MNKLHIEVYSHNFTVTVTTQMDLSMMKRIVDDATVIKKYDRKTKRYVSDLYCSINKAKTVFRLPINALYKLRAALDDRGVSAERIQLTMHTKPAATPASLPVMDKFTPRDYQTDYIDYLTSNSSSQTKVIGIQTGKGKTYIALEALSRIGTRALIYILPKYIDKWISDVNEIYDIEPDRILVIRKGDHLKTALIMAECNEFDYDIIIISNRIHKSYVSQYEEVNGNMDIFPFEVAPENLMDALSVGAVLIDEAHQELKMVASFICYLNVNLLIALTATLVHDDNEVIRMHKLLFPMSGRAKKLKHDQYILMYPIELVYNNPYKLSSSNYGSKDYNHIAFELSLLRNNKTKENYFNAVVNYLNISYIKDYVSGDKAVVFISSIRMATELTDWIKKAYPDKDVRRYVDDDHYSNVIDADIRITTVGGAGTAIDIPNLTTAIQTVNVSSQQSNIQTLGRLRKMDGRDVRFYYFWSKDISKQEKYHLKRLDMLGPLVRNTKELRYGPRI